MKYTGAIQSLVVVECCDVCNRPPPPPQVVFQSSFLMKHVRCQPLELRTVLVQSLNSPFFPLNIGVEPGRAKKRVQDNLHGMLRTPLFFPPNRGKKSYLEVFSRFALWRDFLNDNIQATISAFRLISGISPVPR